MDWILKRFFYIIIFGLLFFGVANGYSVVPEGFSGVWQSPSRFFCFSADDSSDNKIDLAFALYYGWYLDRAVTSDEKDPSIGIKKNSASASFPQELKISFKQLECDGALIAAYELTINNTPIKKSDSPAIIPLAAIGDTLYSNFFIKRQIDGDDFFQAVNHYKNIPTNGRVDQENIICYYVHKDLTFEIRYWKTEMTREAFESAQNKNGDSADNKANSDPLVTFSPKSGGVFRVPKFVDSAGALYTSTTGRRKKVRNVKLIDRPTFISNDTAQIVPKGTPFAKKRPEINRTDFINLIEEQNKARKPSPPPLFIDEIENIDYTGLIDDDLKELKDAIDALPK